MFALSSNLSLAWHTRNMSKTLDQSLNLWRTQLGMPGFCFVSAEQMRAVLSVAAQTQWAEFAASWADLRLDEHMADAGRYRKRRHAVFSVANSGQVKRLPAQPHYQSVDYNPLNGGVPREFAPILPRVAENPLFLELLARFAELVAPLQPEVKNWHAEAHQFRIEPTPDAAGLPTPEGVHRDGVDYVLVLLIARENIVAGTTTVHLAKDGVKTEIGSFTLANAYEAVWLDDTRLFHGVTAVHPKQPGLPAYRDVLVLTFKNH